MPFRLSSHTDEPPLPARVVTTLKGHTEAVYTIAFSPDGKLVLTGSFDKTLKLWETATGKELKTFGGQAGHQNLVLSAAFSPDGRMFASGAADNTAKLWTTPGDGAAPEPAPGGPAKSLAHPNLVDAVAFDPTGTQLATACHDGTVRLWDVAKGQQLRQINAHTTPAPAAVYCLAWTPDGKQVISGSFDHSLKLWDASTGTVVRELKGYKDKESEKGHRDGVFSVAVSPDGQVLASGGNDRAIKTWNLADGSVVRDWINPNLKVAPGAAPAAHPGWVYSVRFTPDGKSLVSAGSAPRNQGFLAVWDAADGRLLHGEELPLGAIYSVAVSPDSKLLALACGPRARGVQEGNGYLVRMPEMNS
jgi:WD40 repeat protein